LASADPEKYVSEHLKMLPGVERGVLERPLEKYILAYAAWREAPGDRWRRMVRISSAIFLVLSAFFFSQKDTILKVNTHTHSHHSAAR